MMSSSGHYVRLGLFAALFFAVGLGAARLLPSLSWEASPPSVYAIIELGSPGGRAILGRFDGSEADDRVFVQAQKMLVTSPDVLAEVFRDSDLQNITTVMNQADPAAWLLHATRVELFEDARLLRVSVAGVNPEQQARLVNAIASKYIKRTKDWLDSSHQETIKALSQFKSALTTSLAEARTRLKEAEAKNEDFAMIEALRDRIASSLEFWKQVTLSLERAEFVESLNRTVSLRVLARPPTRILGK